jgi:predicted PurR-regulated permease PerM
MQSWGLFLLAVIAVCCVVQAVVQTVVLLGLARTGDRLARRVDEMQTKLDGDIRPLLQHLARITQNVSDVSDLAAEQARRIDGVLTTTVDSVEEGIEAVRRSVLSPLARFSDLGAVLRGLRRGLEVYRQLGGIEAQGRGQSRQYAEDEHLFI